jgi:sn-glycerol 3-phosphate transport system substrate-binding protein
MSAAVRRLLAALGVLLLVTVAGCGAGRPEGSLDVPAADALDAAPGVTKVTFWHSMDASNGVALNGLVDKFNAAHAGKIEVQPIFRATTTRRSRSTRPRCSRARRRR